MQVQLTWNAGAWNRHGTAFSSTAYRLEAFQVEQGMSAFKAHEAITPLHQDMQARHCGWELIMRHSLAFYASR